MRDSSHALASLSPGSHACMVYASPEEQMETVAVFLRDGLQVGERCVFASTPDALAGVDARLRRDGVAVDRLRAQGALLLVDRDAFYRPSGRFDLERSLAILRDVAPRARADGFTGVRGAGGPPWTPIDAREASDLREYEERANGYLAAEGVRALCLLDRSTCEPDLIETMLRRHPVALLGGHLCENIFFDPGAATSTESSSHRRTDWMINALIRSHQADALLKDMNQALIREASALATARDGIAAREEGHLKTLDGRDALIRSLARELDASAHALRGALGELAAVPCAHPRDAVDHAREEADRLERIAGRLGKLATLLGPPVSVRADGVDLAFVTAHVVERSRRLQPDVAVELSAPSRLDGCWDAVRLEQLLEELLGVAVEHGWRTPFQVRVEDLGGRARVVVTCRGLEAWPSSNIVSHDGGAEAIAVARDRLNFELASCHELVRILGGTLGVSVWPDARVTITVDLPRAAGPTAGARLS